MVHKIGIKDLMGVGAHFGHRTQRWNPKMKDYIFGKRAGIHIIDLRKTLPMLVDALNAIEKTIASGGRLLFVGTKRQASQIVKEQALRAGQYYVNKRWLGGTLTNWHTIAESIKRLKHLEAQFQTDDFQKLTKRERLSLTRDHEKLENALGGIKDMGGLPDMLFIVDTNKESIAVAEAKRLGIPTVAIVDSNATPDDITYPIPANDDAAKAIAFYCDLVAEATLTGLKKEFGHDKKQAAASDEPTEDEKAPAQPEALADTSQTEKAAHAEEGTPEKAPQEIAPEAPVTSEDADMRKDG
ncbi:30S ribosomal protein S2 [Candidatus Hepatobacter penaei]|uniref:30S ribosomal protein S2 n=1 Tax=Candidatus Hepatobacter penaei TaxID=1274402 RepID=UPI00058DE918|nr:30S ribosomal protein S2 [Candidatus Hepatobacter penaei]